MKTLKIVKYRKLDRSYIIAKILSFITIRNRHFSETWEKLKEHIGSKSTLKKYLQELLDGESITSYEVKKGKGRHRIYYQPKIEKLEEIRNLIIEYREGIKRNDEKVFFEYLNLSIFSSLSVLEGGKKGWHIDFAFLLVFFIEISDMINIDFKKVLEHYPTDLDDDKLEIMKILANFFLKSIG